MVLHPLEFSECFLDSPWFRHSIKEYEDELERTNSQIKQLIKDAKSMLQASRKQGEMMQVFSERLQKFRFEIIGENLTDAERGIAGALKEFGMMLSEIEGEWARTIERSELQLIQPLENFRKEHIHSYREAKKLFDKTSDRYYKQMEQTLGLSHKKKEQQLLEADNDLILQKRHFHGASLNYVFKLQEVQERKKFEFVEHLLMFMQVYFNFFHQTHETAFDCKDYMNDIQMRLVSTRSQYEGTRDKTQMLMRKMMENPNSRATTDGRRGSSPHKVIGQRWARAGYLLLLEKNALGSSRFAAKWTRYFCMYTKENKLFQMLPPITQSSSSISNSSARIGSLNHGNAAIAVDPLIVLSCVRRATDSIDKRFCFDIDVEDSAGKQSTFTLQALSLEDRKKWLAVMDGKEPNYITTNEYKKPEEFDLNETSIKFVENVIEEIERRGVDAEGIYRLVGVASKVDRLLQIVMDPDTFGKLDYHDESEWELNTLTSALKNFFRNLPEPIMTFELHEDFIAAAKHENPKERLNRVVNLVARLSTDSQHILKLLIHHLQKVAAQCEVNKMIVQNIGVCFGPTLMRPKQETVQSIMEIKFNNIIVEILIENYSAIFGEDKDAEEEKANLPKPAIERLPSQRFKTRPKGIHGSPGMDRIQEEGAGRVPRTQQLQVDPNTRFQRGHAIRGPPGKPLSPRSQKKILHTKPESDNESPLSSDNNMDDFGRISPLDMNLNLDHFTLNQTDDRVLPLLVTKPPEPKMEGESPTEEHGFVRQTQKNNSGRKPRLARSFRGSQSERHSTERNRSDVYSVVNKKNGNLNQNNCKLQPGARSPTITQRKEKLLESVRISNSPPSPITHKSSVIKRRHVPVKKPTELQSNSNDHNRRPASIDIEKLKERFSSHEQAHTKARPESDGDHSLSFLWPKPGSIRPNTFVEGSPSERRPRSTVIVSRDDAVAKVSTPDGTLPDITEKSPFHIPLIPTKDSNAPRVRVFETLFACEAEHDSELSFGPGQLIYGVQESEEPGWLVGNINGVTGLVPENYVRERLWE